MINRLRTWWENFDENIKKVVLTALFSVVVVLLAYAIFFVFFRRPSPPPPSFPTELPLGTLPGADIADILRDRGIPGIGEDGFDGPTLIPSELRPDDIAEGGMTLATPLMYTGAQDVSANSNGDINFYNRDDGRFYTLDDFGNVVQLSDEQFPDVENVAWSPVGTKGILEFPDGSNIFYDFESGTRATLPQEGEGFGFSSTGNAIGYKFITGNTDEHWLLVSDPTGDDTIAVEHIGETNPDDVLVNWSPDNSKVAMYRASAGLDNEEVFFVGQDKENFKSLPVAGRGFEGLWSPSGDRLLYNVHSAATGYRPELFVTNARDANLGVQNRSLGLRTWVEKCVFARDNLTVYCAVPVYLQQGSGLYPIVAATVPDAIYKINVQSGFKQQIAVPTNALGIGLYTVETLMLSTDETKIFMVDTRGGIFEIRLE